jgi:peroxiredoxin
MVSGKIGAKRQQMLVKRYYLKSPKGSISQWTSLSVWRNFAQKGVRFFFSGTHPEYLLGLVFIMVVIAGSSCGGSTSPIEAPEVGALAPNFQLKTLDGELVTLSGLRGRPVILNFWATRCGPCIAEMPVLQAAFNEKAAEGLFMLAVDIGENEPIVRKFVEVKELTFNVGLDSSGAVSERYQIQYIPSTFFIDAEGIIRSKKIGSFRSKDEVLAELELIMR